MNLKIDNEIMQTLNQKELYILKYIYAHSNEIKDLSIQSFAKQVSYSPSVILRFCQKIGLSGYSELKYVLRSEFKSTDSETTIQQFSHESISNLMFTDIEGTAGLLNTDDLIEITKLIASDHPLYFYGPGGITNIAIEYLEKMLFLLGRQNIYKFTSRKAALHTLDLLDQNDILFFISTSGTYDLTLEVATKANLCGVTSISISPYINNDLALLCKYNLRFFANQRENSGAEYTSRLSIFFTICALVEYYNAYKEGVESYGNNS